MRARRYTLSIAAIIALLMPLVVTSTTPSLYWTVLDVHGTVTRVSGSPANHAVVLMAQNHHGEWEPLLRTCDGEGAEPYGPFVTIMLTSESGKFALRTSTCAFYADSIAVGVVYPDTTLVGVSFALESVHPTVIEKTGRIDRPNGCDEDYTYPDGSIYEYPAVTFPVP